MARRQLGGKRILLTGASSGIGWALALELSRQGSRLLLTGRREDRLRQLAEEIDRSNAEMVPEFLVGDLTEPGIQRDLVHAAEVQLGGLDGLINCAGVGAVGRFDAATPERMREIFEVNFFSPVELTRLALPLLKLGNQPIIVNVGSVLGHRAVPLKSEYCASKFALHGWSDSLRAELVADGIDLLLVSPSTTDSEFFNNLLEDRTVMNHKGSRPMSPQRVAKAIAVAMNRGKHEIILSTGGKSLVWLDRLFPTLSDWLMARFANGKK